LILAVLKPLRFATLATKIAMPGSFTPGYGI